MKILDDILERINHLLDNDYIYTRVVPFSLKVPLSDINIMANIASKVFVDKDTAGQFQPTTLTSGEYEATLVIHLRKVGDYTASAQPTQVPDKLLN